MSRPIIHIGYHKTGTSFLQKNVFEAYAALFHRVPQREIFDHLIYPDPLLFDDNEAKAFIAQHVSHAEKHQLIPVFSNERLSGGLHTGGYDSAEIAHRIKACLPNGRIIIGIREQRSMIQSAYAQYLKAIGSCSIEEYLDPDTKKNKTLFHFSYLEYHRLISLYHQLFGKENVLVIPYELLKHDKTRYYQVLTEFLDLPGINLNHEKQSNRVVNPSLKQSVLALKRYFNPFVLKGHLFLGSTLYSRPLVILFQFLAWLLKRLPTTRIDRRLQSKLYHSICRKIDGRYEESNVKTAQLINQDLRGLGYLSPEKEKYDRITQA